MYCNEPIQVSSSGAMEYPNGLTSVSFEYNFGKIGEDHVNVVSPVRASKLPKTNNEK